MTLQEALEIEETPLPNRSWIPCERRKAARELLIKAGECVERMKGYGKLPDGFLLPGETKE